MQEVIDILNKNEKAKNLLRHLNRIAIQNNFTEEEYKKARVFVLMLAVLGTPEALDLMARATYEEINGRG